MLYVHLTSKHIRLLVIIVMGLPKLTRQCGISIISHNKLTELNKNNESMPVAMVMRDHTPLCVSETNQLHVHIN